MKKLYFKNKKSLILNGTALSAIIAVAVVNVSLSMQNNSLSTVSLANVEALAQESGGGGTNVVCKCSKMQDQNCAANNWGSNCASGNNVHCWEYNLNCN
jgi:hypothetical protein